MWPKAKAKVTVTAKATYSELPYSCSHFLQHLVHHQPSFCSQHHSRYSHYCTCSHHPCSRLPKMMLWLVVFNISTGTFCGMYTSTLLTLTLLQWSVWSGGSIWWVLHPPSDLRCSKCSLLCVWPFSHCMQDIIWLVQILPQWASSAVSSSSELFLQFSVCLQLYLCCHQYLGVLHAHSTHLWGF